MKEPDTQVKTSEKAAQADQPPALEQRIRIRAFELYESRHGEPGDPNADWLRAEAEVLEKEVAR